jgi:hypothetical protein
VTFFGDAVFLALAARLGFGSAASSITSVICASTIGGAMTSGMMSTIGDVSDAAATPSRSPTPHPCGTEARGGPPLANTRSAP